MNRPPRRLVQNALRCADGVFLKSTHVHDYTTHTAEDGSWWMTDGGCEYVRRGWDGPRGKESEDFCLYEDDPLDRVADRLLWGTRGKDGKGPFRWVLLRDCEAEHLKAILSTQAQAAPVVKFAILYLLARRP